MTLLLVSILSFLPMILMLVVMHEFGHYLTARLFRVKVHEFGVGFPPRIKAWYRGRTRVEFTDGTVFVDGRREDLAPGMRVTLLSRAGSEPRSLEACYLWTGRPSRLGANPARSLGQFFGFSSGTPPAAPTANFDIHDLRESFGLLEHTGIVREVGDDGMALADMAWALNALPLGGYVRMAAEDNDERVPGGFAAKPIWQRAIIIASGALVNAAFPVAAFVVMLSMPHSALVADGPVRVSQVKAESPAARAGLVAGDTITHVNAEPVQGASGLAAAVRRDDEGALELTVVREGDVRRVELTPIRERRPGQGALGVSVQPAREPSSGVPPWESVPRSAELTGELYSAMGESVSNIAQGEESADVRGPVGIAQLAGLITLQQGFAGWMLLAIIISINLAIFNLLPIPMLDGGRLFLLMIEACRGGRKLDPGRERMVHVVGLAVLLTIVVAVMFNDFVKLFGG